ncbi:MAG TPA: glycosyltransferase family 4 protein [Leptolinea sp.]
MPKNRSDKLKIPLDIVFYVISSHGEKLHIPDYPERIPLGGSETAALRLAETMRKIGHSVRIITDNEQLNGLTCDVFISLRVWQVFHAGFFPGKVNYLWCQDDRDQKLVEDLHKPEIAIPLYNRLNGLFLLSTYQQVQWIRSLNLMVEKIIPTTNGIPYEMFTVNKTTLRDRKPWAYYSSTPFRGLKLLLQAWPSIRQAVPQSQLHLFTSMKVYNAEDSNEYMEMYTAARSLPGVHYHGSVGQAELRETAQKCRALAYPCTFPETSCIAAMEAMAAGCAVVSTSAGALIETAWHNPLIAPGGDWLPIWSQALIKILTDDNEYERLALQNIAIAKYYDWPLIAVQWLDKFSEDLN